MLRVKRLIVNMDPIPAQSMPALAQRVVRADTLLDLEGRGSSDRQDRRWRKKTTRRLKTGCEEIDGRVFGWVANKAIGARAADGEKVRMDIDDATSMLGLERSAVLGISADEAAGVGILVS